MTTNELLQYVHHVQRLEDLEEELKWFLLNPDLESLATLKKVHRELGPFSKK